MKEQSKIKQSKLKTEQVGFFLYSHDYDREKQMIMKVLLHKRDGKTPYSPNKWDFFGGKVEKGETAEEALTRELYEELGIWVKKNKIKLFRDIPNKRRRVFCVSFPINKKREIRLGEGDGFAWFLIDDALNKDILKGLAEEAHEDLEIFRESGFCRLADKMI